MNRIVIVLLGVTLASCANIPALDPSGRSVLEGGKSFVAPITNPLVTKKSEFNIVNNSFGGALAVFVNFRDACADRLLPPACRTAVQKTVPYLRKAQGTRNAARFFVKKYPKLDARNVVEAFRDAVNDFKVIQMEQGIQ